MQKKKIKPLLNSILVEYEKLSPQFVLINGKALSQSVMCVIWKRVKSAINNNYWQIRFTGKDRI